MELKPYQQQVINDLKLFLDHVQRCKNTRDAFNDFWITHPRTSIHPFPGTAIEPYKNNIPRVPHVCIKVPTAGGKTFIACNALKPIFNAFDYDQPRVVVWLVPSRSILEQTLKNLSHPAHPYRQKINAHFGHRVEVLDKAALLQGTNFHAGSVGEQLTIMVFTFDSLRARNKEDRKVFQENGYLQSFEHLMGRDTDITLGAVIKHLNPVVVVDESHNAETELSVDMLKELNPSFILDLTATPRKNSNIISFIDALELKKEFMVKLPVIVYNHHDKTDVINSALQLQRRLEIQAKEEEKKGGKYIRPIVLFQAQSKGPEDNVTFEKLKAKLIELQIPAEHIRIKTSNNDEIEGEDLLSKKSQVRYIITVNALKEGWDCPFAYILASLADKSSAVDVEQILGRVLRQPYTIKHDAQLLNVSYVLTASSKFNETLQNIVKGLNRAGFSDKDYRIAEPDNKTQLPYKEDVEQLILGDLLQTNTVQTSSSSDKLVLVEQSEGDIADDIDTKRIILPQVDGAIPDKAAPNEIQHFEKIRAIEQQAMQGAAEFEKTVAELDESHYSVIPNEVKAQMKTYSLKEHFREQAQQIQVPQFFKDEPSSGLFSEHDGIVLLEKEYLLEGFALSKADRQINFEDVKTDLYQVDLDEYKKDHTPTFMRLDGKVKEKVMSYILDPTRKEKRVKNFTDRIMSIIGNMYPIPDSEIKKYISSILGEFSDEQFTNFADKEYDYVEKIKQKIRFLSEEYAEKQFKILLDTDGITIKPSYTFPLEISPSVSSKDLPKTLYEKESRMNGFEERVINEVANMENIQWWTRNIEKRGFRINGFINHYPDFVISTKSGKIIVLETKGDHLDAKQKITMGNIWASKAGNNYRYYMVYEHRTEAGAETLADFLEKLRRM